MRDKVSLIKDDGSRFDDIKANVQPHKIFIDDASLPIEEGDKLIRTLPNNLVESYIVLDRGYYESIGDIPSHYQVKVRKESVIPASTPSSIVYNLIGDSSRVNINSQDISVNVKNITSGDLFEKLKKAIEENEDNVDKKSKLLSLVDEMEDAQGTDRFRERYKEFVATAADHMTLLIPFLHALTQLLS
ncbi:MAG: hypothetical protein U9O85_05625 [Euryarchaeota archaeon]|nr:hypothetical protein [Euryarchaeota archaeon]